MVADAPAAAPAAAAAADAAAVVPAAGEVGPEEGARSEDVLLLNTHIHRGWKVSFIEDDITQGKHVRKRTWLRMLK